MEKKTKKIKNKNSTKKAIKKTSGKFIAPKNNQSVDEAVPVSLLLSKKNTRPKPQIKFSAAGSLSPYVISFAQPPAVSEVTNPNWRLDFALSESELKNQITVENKINLHHNELASQFSENDYTTSRSSIPTVNFFLPSWSTIHEAINNFQTKNHIHEPTVLPLDWRSLELPVELEVLEEILPFDLPEMENGEIEEADILTWDEVVNSVVQEKNVEVKNEKSRSFITFWYEKVISLKKWGQINIQQSLARLPKLTIFNYLPTGWHRALTAFVLVSFAFVLPIHAMGTIHNLQAAKNNLTINGLSAINNLDSALTSLLSINATQAAASFSEAEKNFSQARSTIDNLGTATSFILSVLPNTKETFNAGNHLVTAGENLAVAGKKISDGLDIIQNNNLTNTGKLEILTQTFNSIIPSLEAANKNLQKISLEIVPADHQQQFSQLQTSLPFFLTAAKEVTAFSQTLSTLLGANGKKRYLLLFQNNTELRPTGGFLGSFALLDVNHGEITNLEVPEGGSYDLQGSLKNNYSAPFPLQLLSARWEFQDANWFPDFPTSARQVLQFYQDASGPTVDGVVAINASFINSLLNILGPITLPEYQQTIDAENFLFTTQKMVEYDYVNYVKDNTSRKEAAPKAFIGDLATAMLSQAQNLEVYDFLKVIDAVHRGLNQKDIQLYFTNEGLEKSIRDLNWDGGIKTADQDYLMVVNSNLGGGKTDGVIEEKINLSVNVSDHGKIQNTLTITRHHQGRLGVLFTGVNNVNFLRIYVPGGSKLISASGFSIPDSSLFEIPDSDWQEDSDVAAIENSATIDPDSGTIISEENGKTTFGNWVQTKPGETSTVTFVYEPAVSLTTERPGLLQIVKNKIGLSVGPTYSLLIQKQSGVLDRSTTVNINSPSDWKTTWSSIDNQGFDNSTDQLVGAVFENK